MTDEEAHWANAAAGSRDAAAWALKLLGGFQGQGSVRAAMEMLDHLQTLSLDRKAVLMIQLVNLVGRTGVASPDVATLLVKLREQAGMDDPPRPRQ